MTRQATSVKVVGGLTLTAALVAVLSWFITSNHRGMYINEYSTIIATAETRQAAADYQKKQGSNSVAVYGCTSDLTSTSGRVRLADLILKYRRAGVKAVGYPYGSASSVTGSLASYNAWASDSCKFSYVISEIEPYNTGDYAGFYTAVRTVGTWAKAKGLQSFSYMGWPTEACWDSIVVNCDGIFLHDYVSSSTISTGGGQYGYMKGRLTTISAKAKARNKKMLLTTIYSCEPSFSFTYFQSHTYQSTYSLFTSYYNVQGTSDMKNYLTQMGYMVFVSKYAKQIKP